MQTHCKFNLLHSNFVMRGNNSLFKNGTKCLMKEGLQCLFTNKSWRKTYFVSLKNCVPLYPLCRWLKEGYIFLDIYGRLKIGIYDELQKLLYFEKSNSILITILRIFSILFFLSETNKGWTKDWCTWKFSHAKCSLLIIIHINSKPPVAIG